MGKFRDLTGQKFGKLTVLYRDFPYKNPTKWVCECECGNIKSIRGTALTGHLTSSCGCLKNENLVGQKFNRLTVIELLNERTKHRQKIYKCKCDCGNFVNVVSNDLKSENTKSCGCYNVELAKDRCIDIKGQRFGLLTVLKKGSGDVPGVLYWECQCDCGNITNVPSRNLRDGRTISCGCIHSLGEQKISNILKENNIMYQQQYTFDNFRFKDTGGTPRYDFCIIDNNNNVLYLIEYDGIQHFKAIGGWNDVESYEQRHAHDIEKNIYCLNNKIPLIRIPYYIYDDLSINDLLLKTTKYLITTPDMEEAEELIEEN